MRGVGVTADMVIKTNGNSMCVNCTDVCHVLNLKVGDKVRVTFEIEEEGE